VDTGASILNMDNVTARNEAVSSLKQGIASGPRKSIGAGERPRNDIMRIADTGVRKVSCRLPVG
jgi:hypothetical protein